MTRLLTVICALFVAAIAFSQVPRSLIGASPREFLLFRPDVQADLNLTSKQKRAIEEAGGDSVSMEGGSLRVSIGPDTNIEDIKSQVRKALTAEQSERLTEIWIQLNSYLTLGDPILQKALSLSKNQIDRINDAMNDFGETMREIISSNGGRVTPDDMKEARETLNKKLKSTLTADQLKNFESMKGKPFKAAKP